jgi:hypothetical protein
VLPILYLRGLSTGDFGPAQRDLLGEDASGPSASSIQRLSEQWQAEHSGFRQRSLRFHRCAYLFVDGVHMSVRLGDDDRRVAKWAGIAAHIHPHLLRHAYGDHVARHAGLRAAQALLGHAAVDTTAGTYVDRPTLDELAVSVHGFSYRGYPREEHLEMPGVETAGIEPASVITGLITPTVSWRGAGSRDRNATARRSAASCCSR